MKKIYCVHRYIATITEYILIKRTRTTVRVKPYENAISSVEKIESTHIRWFNTFEEAKQHLILYYNEEIHFHANCIESNVSKLKSVMNLQINKN